VEEVFLEYRDYRLERLKEDASLADASILQEFEDMCHDRLLHCQWAGNQWAVPWSKRIIRHTGDEVRQETRVGVKKEVISEEQLRGLMQQGREAGKTFHASLSIVQLTPEDVIAGLDITAADNPTPAPPLDVVAPIISREVSNVIITFVWHRNPSTGGPQDKITR